MYNIVFIPIPVKEGMAGTKRLNNLIYYLPEKKFQITNFIISGNTFIKFLKSIKLCFILFRVKKNDKKNILYHYSNINIQTIIPCILAKILGYKLIVDLVEDYDLINHNEIQKKGKIRVAFIISLQKTYKFLVDGYVIISSHLEKKIAKSSNSSKPFVHIPVSFNPDDFKYMPSRKNNNNSINLFYGGTFADKDGLDYLLAAFDKFAAIEPNATLITTGKINKNYVGTYQSNKKKLRHKDRIIELGFVSEEKYLDTIKNSDILCMTRNNSGFANAGFPFKLAAFLATGNPVIATKVSNITDYLTENSCYLIQPNSTDEIYNALCSINNNKTFAKKIGNKGKEIAYKYFDASLHYEKFVELLRKV